MKKNIALTSLILITVLTLAAQMACANLPVPNDTAPHLTTTSLDEAALACLDWAWSVNHTREVAGGVLWNEGKLTCSPLTLGTRSSVEYELDTCLTEEEEADGWVLARSGCSRRI